MAAALKALAARRGCLRVRGVVGDVYERAAELREVGAALALWPNAPRLLQRMGVLEGLMKRAHVPAVGALRDWRGKELKKMVSLRVEVPALFLHRADLQQGLLAAIPAEQVHLNKTFVSLEREGGKTRAGGVLPMGRPALNGRIKAGGGRMGSARWCGKRGWRMGRLNQGGRWRGAGSRTLMRRRGSWGRRGGAGCGLGLYLWVADAWGGGPRRISRGGGGVRHARCRGSCGSANCGSVSADGTRRSPRCWRRRLSRRFCAMR